MTRRPKASKTSATKRGKFVVCIKNAEYEASLERRKLYRVIPDSAATRDGLIRVIDESGEDYLYPASLFRDIALTVSLRRALALAAQ